MNCDGENNNTVNTPQVLMVYSTQLYEVSSTRHESIHSLKLTEEDC